MTQEKQSSFPKIDIVQRVWFCVSDLHQILSFVLLHSEFIVKSEMSTNSARFHEWRVSWRKKAMYPMPRAFEVSSHFLQGGIGRAGATVDFHVGDVRLQCRHPAVDELDDQQTLSAPARLSFVAC